MTTTPAIGESKRAWEFLHTYSYTTRRVIDYASFKQEVIHGADTYSLSSYLLSLPSITQLLAHGPHPRLVHEWPHIHGICGGYARCVPGKGAAVALVPALCVAAAQANGANLIIY